MSSCILGPITSIAFGSAQFQGLFCSGAQHSQQSYPWLLSPHRGTMFTLFLCFSMLVYPTATLGAGLSNPKATRSAILSLNRGFRRNTASPRCVSLVRRPFLCPLTINPTQQVCHLNNFIVLDLDVAKQTSILRHYSVGNVGREISDHIFQGCFWSHQKYCKNLLRAILARTNVIPSGSTRSWGAINGGETKSEGQVYVQGYII